MTGGAVVRWGVFISALLVAGVVLAEEVLPPSAGEKVSEAFDRLPAPWVMDSASVDGGSVSAAVCRGESGECFELVLSKPSDDCSGTSLPAWCVAYEDGSPVELRTAVESVFKVHRLTEFWSAPTRTEAGERALSAITIDFIWDYAQVYLLALATLFGPLLLGLLLGWGWRKRLGRARSRFAFAVALALPMVPAVALPMEWLRIGFHDLVLMGGLAAAGFLWVAHEVARSFSRNELGLLLVGLLLGSAVAEVGTRIFAGPPPAYPPPDAASFVLPTSGGFPHSGASCDSLFPALHPGLVAARTRFPERPVQVLHAGDSMLEGDESPPERRTVYLLNEADPAVSHIDAGFSGTGADHYYLTSRRWLEVAPVDQVVWHVFLYNDVDESMSHPYACCANLAPLEFSPDGFKIRCEEPADGGFFGNRLVNSPAPYFLRVATHFSHFARHLCYLMGRQARALLMEGVTVAEGWRRFRMVVKAMHEELEPQGIPLVIVMVPYRGEWEAFAAVLEQQGEKRAFVQSLCDEFGIPCLDGREAFDDAIVDVGPEPFFINKPVWDFHFSDEGHRLYAEWLTRVLPTPTRP